MEWAFDAISLKWIRKHSVCVRAQLNLWLWSAFGINFLVAIKNKRFDFTHRDSESSHTVWQGQSTEIEWNSKMFIVCQTVENCRIVSRFGCARSLCPNREIRFLRFQAISLWCTATFPKRLCSRWTFWLWPKPHISASIDENEMRFEQPKMF